MCIPLLLPYLQHLVTSLVDIGSISLSSVAVVSSVVFMHSWKSGVVQRQHTHTHTHTHVHAHPHTPMHTRTYTHTCTHTHTRMRVCVCVHVCVCVFQASRLSQLALLLLNETSVGAFLPLFVEVLFTSFSVANACSNYLCLASLTLFLESCVCQCPSVLNLREVSPFRYQLAQGRGVLADASSSACHAKASVIFRRGHMRT